MYGNITSTFCLLWIFDCSVYQVPRFAKYDHQRDCLKVKLVGSIVHGTVLVFFLVMPTVKDDTNLQCHVLSRTLHHAQVFRKKQGLSESFPAETRQQIDGVGTNWGSIHFAHFEHLAREDVFGCDTYLILHFDVVFLFRWLEFTAFFNRHCDVARNPVGFTHEDIDGVYGITSPYIKQLNVLTPEKVTCLNHSDRYRYVFIPTYPSLARGGTSRSYSADRNPCCYRIRRCCLRLHCLLQAACWPQIVWVRLQVWMCTLPTFCVLLFADVVALVS